MPVLYASADLRTTEPRKKKYKMIQKKSKKTQQHKPKKEFPRKNYRHDNK